MGALIAAWRTLGVSIDPRKQVCKAAAFEELHDDVRVPGSVGAIDLDQQRSEPVDRRRALLELSQTSIRRYQRPNGETVALLVMAPSKTDRERVIPMSGGLLHVLAELVRFHTRGVEDGPEGGEVLLVCRATTGGQLQPDTAARALEGPCAGRRTPPRPGGPAAC